MVNTPKTIKFSKNGKEITMKEYFENRLIDPI